MAIIQTQVKRILSVGGHTNSLIDQYMQFAEERLGADWLSLFNNENELLEDADLFAEAGTLEIKNADTDTGLEG